MRFARAPKAKKTSRRCISFASENDVEETISLEEFSQEEFQASWYNKEALKELRRDISCTVSLVDLNVKLDDGSSFCERGVERYTKADAKVRSESIRATVRAVMCEQEHQRVRKTADPEAIATASKEQTQTCRTKAASRGISDESAAWSVDTKVTEAGPSRAKTFRLPQYVNRRQQRLPRNTM